MKASKKCTILSLDNNGGAIKVSPEDFTQNPKQFTWVRLRYTGAKKFLKNLDLPSLAVTVLTASETRPRFIAVDNALMGTLRGINHQKDDPEDMVSVRMLIQDNLIVTVQREDIAAVDEIVKQLENDAGPKNIADFLQAIVAGLTDQSSEISSKLDDDLDVVEDYIHSNNANLDRHQLNDLRRRIIALRRYLVPQREAINRISAEQLKWLSTKHMLKLRESADANIRVIEDLDAMRDRATVLHEEIFAMNQEKMNQKMYVLAIVAVIFMPLGFITGLLGINVGGIPGAEFKFGFLSVCGILFIIVLLQLYYLRRKRWI